MPYTPNPKAGIPAFALAMDQGVSSTDTPSFAGLNVNGEVYFAADATNGFISIGSNGGSTTNLLNDGSGSTATGNITWNASGTLLVPFLQVGNYARINPDGSLTLSGAAISAAGYGYLANYNITWDADGNLNAAGNLTAANLYVGAYTVIRNDGSAQFLNAQFNSSDASGNIANAAITWDAYGNLSVPSLTVNNGTNVFNSDGSASVSNGGIGWNTDGSLYAQRLLTPVTAPAHTDAGTPGQMIFTDTYTYRCFASSDWRRAAVTYSTY